MCSAARKRAGFLFRRRFYKHLVPTGRRISKSQVGNDLSNQTFLITGAHGFIGAWIVKRLLENSGRIVIFDQSADPQRLRLIMNEEEISRTKAVTGDITEADALLPIIDSFGITNVIHLAGLQVPTCKANPRLGAMVNVLGTINVFEAARLRQ